MRVASRLMRVIIGSGVLVLGVALLAALTPNAAAAHSRPSIACPLLATPPTCCGPPIAVPAGPVSADVVPCCPVPTAAGCCGPVTGIDCCATTPCPTTLSIAASPDPVDEGSNATISGTMTGGTVASQTVALYERLAGQAAFSNVAQTQTSASGAFTFVRAVQTNAEWYVNAGTTQSSTITESVLAAIVLHPSSVRPQAGAKVMLSGTIAPSHAGERVALQRLRARQWVTIARPRLNAQSHFATWEKMPGSSARFRVVLAGDARNGRSVSGVVAITAS